MCATPLDFAVQSGFTRGGDGHSTRVTAETTPSLGGVVDPVERFSLTLGSVGADTPGQATRGTASYCRL